VEVTTMKLRRRQRALRGCLSLALTWGAAAAQAGSFVDGFDSGVIDPAWWTASADGGSTLLAANQRIEVSQGAGGAAGLAFNVAIQGDFTARIDYQLLVWPEDNGERAALGAVHSPAQQLLIERVSDSAVGAGAEVYVTDFTGQGILGSPTSDLEGTLQLERIGDVVTGSYWNGSGWQGIGTYSAAGEGDVARTIGFGIFPGAAATPGITVAFDDFFLQGPNVPVPEPGTALLLAGGLALLASGSTLRRG
jgi:hypothetical protein